MSEVMFGLEGVSESLQFGKEGLKIKSNGVAISVVANDEGQLVALKAKNGSASDELVTKAQLDTKQGNLTIASESQAYLKLENNELSVKQLLIHDVTVNTSDATIADFVAANYTVGDEFQEGDMVVLTAATNSQKRTWIHNGGTAKTTADFTSLQVDISEVVIRAMFSAGTGISYNASTGVISCDVEANEVPASAVGFNNISGSTVQALFQSIDSFLSSSYMDNCREVEITYQTAGTFNLEEIIPAGKNIRSVAVQVVTAWNGSTPSLKIGTSGNTSAYMGTESVDLKSSNKYYEKKMIIPLTSATQVIGTIIQSGSTQGAAKIVVDFC